MEQNERDAHNHMTALQGENPHRIGTRAMRRISPESLGVLQLVGSPFAGVFNAALNGEKVTQPPNIQPVDISVFAWVHSAPADEVLETALECAPGFAAPAVKAAMQYVRTWSMDELSRVVQFALSDAAATTAAGYEVAAPDYGTPDAKKNG